MKQNQEAILRRVAWLTESQECSVNEDGTVEQDRSVDEDRSVEQERDVLGGQQMPLDQRSDGNHDSRPSVSRTQESVVKAYTALHGHPMEHDGRLEGPRETRRWALGMKAGLAILVALAVVLFVRQCSAVGKESRTELSVAGSGVSAAVSNTTSESSHEAAGLAPEGSTNRDEGSDQNSPKLGNTQAGSSPNETSSDAVEANSTNLVVHVAGQVKLPGVYELSQGDRVIDAVKSAGGFLSSADTNHLNLAQRVEDGAQIYVPKPGEQERPDQQLKGALTGGSGESGSSDASGHLININTASRDELESLPGVGPTLAQRIIDWRTQHGDFTSVEELASVKGVGPAIMGEITSLVTL